MSEKIKLQAAKVFIHEKNYDAAKFILLQISNNPIAQKWLEKLSLLVDTKEFNKDISSLSDNELITRFQDDDALGQIMVRILKYQWEYKFAEIFKIKQQLHQMFLSIDNYNNLERLCGLLYLFDYWDENDPLIECLVKFLRSKDYKFRELARPLIHMNTISSERNLLAYPINTEDQDNWGIKILETENKDNYLKIYQVFQNKEQLFAMKISRKGKKYEITYPDYEKIKQYLYIVNLVERIAHNHIHNLMDKDQYEEIQRDGWNTYVNDIAPYETD